jgi:hypothetical protein
VFRIIGKAIGFLIALALIPIAVLANLVMLPFTDGKYDFTPAEFAERWRRIIEGNGLVEGGDYNYDDFDSVEIRDPRLEAIRRRAFRVSDPPWSDEDKAELMRLLAEVEALTPKQ